MLDDHKCHTVTNPDMLIFKYVSLYFKALYPTYMKHNSYCEVRKTIFPQYVDDKWIGQHDF